MKIKVFIWQLEKEKVGWGWFIQLFLHFILFAENFMFRYLGLKNLCIQHA